MTNTVISNVDYPMRNCFFDGGHFAADWQHFEWFAEYQDSGSASRLQQIPVRSRSATLKLTSAKSALSATSNSSESTLIADPYLPSVSELPSGLVASRRPLAEPEVEPHLAIMGTASTTKKSPAAAVTNNNVNDGKSDLTPTTAKPAKRKGPSGIAKLYLIMYNFLQTIGWSYLFYQVVQYHVDGTPTKGSLYDKVQWTVIIFQNAAVLEVVHAALRIVPSNPMITLQQVASRVVVVCGVLIVTTASRNTVGLPLLLIAWSLTEIIRYANYTFGLLNALPHIITWLRYSTFIVLYPIGVTGELLCLYAAAQEVGETKLWTLSMPNAANVIFNYKYFLLFTMALYVPLFPQMYMHMVSQRKKVLGRSASDKKLS